MIIKHHTVTGKIGRTQWEEDHDVSVESGDLFPPASHAHAIGDSTGLQTALDGKAGTSHGHAPSDVSGTAVVTNDSRLSDARTPIAHNQAISTVTNLQTTLDGKAASSHAHAPGDVTGTAVITNDSRLSDARTPTAHSHAPSDVTGTAVVTNDSRLSDARAPVAHNQAETTITFTDVATGNSATGQHGYLPKLGGGTTNFLRADGTWAAVANGGQPLGLTVLANDTLAQALATNINTQITVTAARTLTTTVPAAGTRCSIKVLTSGTSSFVITFGSGFKPTGTLATGTTNARVFIINWFSDGTNLYEAGRTAAMAA